jgi:hypothetical protein
MDGFLFFAQLNIHKSTDGGFSLAPQYSTTDFANIYSVYFINALTGWASGYREIILKLQTAE